MTGIELYQTQLELLDRVRTEGGHGEARGAVLKTVALEHVFNRLEGRATTFVSGLARQDLLSLPRPDHGDARLAVTLHPVSGKAIPVMAGEVLRIEQVGGGQCVDFNAFNLHDYKEALDCGFTRSFQSFTPEAGELIWTNAPRGRPMWVIMEMAESCDVDIAGHRCNRVAQEYAWGITNHANCQDTIAEAIREYGLTPDDVHDSFNLWMSTAIDATGRRRFKWNPAQPGDRVEFLALFDVLAVPATCGIGDLVGVNNFTFSSVNVEVLAATAAALEVVERVNERWGRLTTQVTPELAETRKVLSTRGLTADPSYRAEFLPVPGIEVVEVTLEDHEAELFDRLVGSGLYGRDRSEAIRAAFMRWCNENRALIPRAKIEFTPQRSLKPAAPV